MWVQLEDGAGNRSIVHELQTCLDLYPALPSSSSYRLWNNGITSAGGNSNSASFQLTNTAGQTASGALLTSGSYQLRGGFGGGTAVPGSDAYQPFQCGAAQTEQMVYLPMVVKP